MPGADRRGYLDARLSLRESCELAQLHRLDNLVGKLVDAHALDDAHVVVVARRVAVLCATRPPPPPPSLSAFERRRSLERLGRRFRSSASPEG